MSSTRVAPEEAPRIHPRPETAPTTMASLLEATMKGVTSNHFLRSEKVPGSWASGQETLTFHQAYEQAVCFAIATATRWLTFAWYSVLESDELVSVRFGRCFRSKRCATFSGNRESVSEHAPRPGSEAVRGFVSEHASRVATTFG